MRPALALLASLAALPAAAEDVAAWPPLQRRFESTGGGGWTIDRYHPVVIGDRCVTPFSAISPAGEEHRNLALFEAVPVAGGVLCTAGRWRAEDGTGGEGTTPLRVFIRADGARFRSP
jgi:hypothetical protein